MAHCIVESFCLDRHVRKCAEILQKRLLQAKANTWNGSVSSGYQYTANEMPMQASDKKFFFKLSEFKNVRISFIVDISKNLALKSIGEYTAPDQKIDFLYSLWK